MIPANRALIRYTWARGTRQVGTVEVSELPPNTSLSIRNLPKPRFIPEAERKEEPIFECGVCDASWMQGDPAETPAGVFGDILLSTGFSSWDHIRDALLAFMNIEGCDWARQMLGNFHPDVLNDDKMSG